nr:hypothetical protein [Tanacetum cinerariifolium]GEY33529.1 hypothetical protein [Tanacetum cinerariifolium]
KKVFVLQEVPLKEVNVAAATTITATIDDITLAKALMEIKSEKPKAATTITAASTRPKAKGLDKGKGNLVEPEPVKKLSKKDQLILDEEVAFKLQAKEEEQEEEGLAREKAQQIKERAGKELEQENAKKQKIEDDKESAELKQYLEIIPEDGDDVTIDATPLSSNKMPKSFDKEDLEVLWRLVKARFEKIKPLDYMDNLLLHNLKTMFEHHVEDNV